MKNTIDLILMIGMCGYNVVYEAYNDDTFDGDVLFTMDGTNPKFNAKKCTPRSSGGPTFRRLRHELGQLYERFESDRKLFLLFTDLPGAG